MKKLIGFIAAVLMLSACTTEEYYETGTRVYSKVFTVDRWYYDEYDGIFYYSFDEPLLTKSVINNGMIAAYYYYKIDNKSASLLQPLPYSDFLIETDKDGYVINKWEEQLTVEFEPGAITFLAKIDDYAVDDRGKPMLPSRDYYEFVVKFTY